MGARRRAFAIVVMSPASLGVASIYIASLAAVTVVAVGLGGANRPPATVLAAALMPMAVPIALARTASPERQRSIWMAMWGLVLIVGLCLLVPTAARRCPTAMAGS